MKVAVCVSGLVDPDSDSLMDALQNKFHEYDFFFGVWKGRENDLSVKLNAWSFEEPEPTYHPYFDVDIPGMPQKILDIRANLKANPDMELLPKSLHHTKQILIHSYMLDQLPEEYDMIMRTRYDIDLFDDSIDFEQFVTESYNNNHATGFAKNWFPKHGKTFNPRGSELHRFWEGYLMDNVIIHPKPLFDKELMISLHNHKMLLPAEFGWYQVLSQPHGDTHQNYFSSIRIARDTRSVKGLRI